MPKMRAELAEEEEVVAPLITKEVPTTLKSGRVEVEVWKSVEKVLKSVVESPAMVELKRMEPHVNPVTIRREESVILAADRMAEII